MNKNTALSVKNLSIDIKILRGTVPAVRGISFDVYKGEILGIVGESGCGKSTAMHAIARLLPEYAKIKMDFAEIDGINITNPTTNDLLAIRGDKIAYIFQDPQASLNPVMTIKDQIIETILIKNNTLTESEAYQKSKSLLEDVKINQPDIWLNSYPHQLSGGMKQRIMIAIALANSPVVLVADEPTTSLDVTVQSEILNLLKSLNQSQNMSIIFITHDLSVAKKLCDRIAVMYAGKIVEIDSAEKIATSPRHPYTQSLWNSIPNIDKSIEKLSVIPGTVPSPMKLPSGCKFHPRCEYAQDKCRENEPERNPENNTPACFFPL